MTEAITVIPRIEAGGTPILFLPDDATSRSYYIACYARVGQHSEAHIDYYYETKPDKTNACADLLKEYAGIPPQVPLKIRKRRRLRR